MTAIGLGLLISDKARHVARLRSEERFWLNGPERIHPDDVATVLGSVRRDIAREEATLARYRAQSAGAGAGRGIGSDDREQAMTARTDADEPTRGNRACDYLGEDDPPAIEAARRMLRAYIEGTREIDELVWALAILHGTWRDAWAPKGFAPPFKLAIGPLRAAVGIIEPEKTLEECRALLEAMPPAPWLRGAQ